MACRRVKAAGFDECAEVCAVGESNTVTGQRLRVLAAAVRTNHDEKVAILRRSPIASGIGSCGQPSIKRHFRWWVLPTPEETEAQPDFPPGIASIGRKCQVLPSRGAG